MKYSAVTTPVFAVWLVVVCLIPAVAAIPYLVDDFLGVGRQFDGIGGISGGGATSKLLQNYPEPQRSQVLDYLFKPNFGASLHILKVEIGGDSQSTDGTETSHMHTEEDENYHRGYEWWMMKEAKQRNPHIKLYGLPWVFPGWLGQGQFSPYVNRSNLVRYITNWIHGAAKVHNLTIDYIGIWNERPYDVKYIKMLRRALDNRGFSHVRIVAADREWDFLPDILKDPELADAVDVIGVHYPGSHSPPEALITDRKLWASEEYSAYNDIHGAGCWARVLNEGYVNGYLTSNIAWNIISSYYAQLPYSCNGLMTADEPWSGHYEVAPPIWMTAHHTQFMQPGWHYLLHNYGVGNLTGNGTYVALTSPDAKQLTIVIETMDPANAPCFYAMPKYPVAREQVATFQLRGSYKNIKFLNVWFSELRFDGMDSTYFKHLYPVNVVDGFFSLYLKSNMLYTLTTLDYGRKGNHGNPPSSAPFPKIYKDNFEGYAEFADPYNFAPQAGAFEIRKTSDAVHGKVMMQVVPEPPIDTCLPKPMTRPVGVIGNFNAPDLSMQCQVFVPSSQGGASGVFMALRVDKGGCDTMYSNGIYFWIYPVNSTYIVSGNHDRSKIYKFGTFKMALDQWFTITMAVKGDISMGYINDSLIFEVGNLTSASGFAALGTEDFGFAYFDNLVMNYTDKIIDINESEEHKRNVLRYKDMKQYRKNKLS